MAWRTRNLWLQCHFVLNFWFFDWFDIWLYYTITRGICRHQTSTKNRTKCKTSWVSIHGSIIWSTLYILSLISFPSSQPRTRRKDIVLYRLLRVVEFARGYHALTTNNDEWLNISSKRGIVLPQKENIKKLWGWHPSDRRWDNVLTSGCCCMCACFEYMRAHTLKLITFERRRYEMDRLGRENVQWYRGSTLAGGGENVWSLFLLVEASKRFAASDDPVETNDHDDNEVDDANIVHVWRDC